MRKPDPKAAPSVWLQLAKTPVMHTSSTISGKFSWENSVASSFAQDKTIVVGTDDATPGQIYVYVGEKQAEGNVVEKAGLVGGDLYGIAVDGVANEQSGVITSGSRFSLIAVGEDGDASRTTGSDLDTQSDTLGVTEFLRPEDAAWDPTNPNVLYFATTSTPSRLIKVTFDDITNPLTGGVVDVVLGPETGVNSLDNIAVAADGKVYMQEDPGGSSRLAKIWVYDPATGATSEVAQHNPDLFATCAPNFLTTNEESSGIIDATALLGDADTEAFLLDVQSHRGVGDAELVEDGQFLVMYVDDVQSKGSAGDDALNGDATANRLSGAAGADVIRGGSGGDYLLGGDGDDTIVGGAGRDGMTGGAGADTFVFLAFSDSTKAARDFITDFNAADGDTIDLSAIDAISGGANDAFTAVAAFSNTAGELVISYNAKVNSTVISADVDGDGVADFQLALQNVQLTDASAIIL